MHKHNFIYSLILTAAILIGAASCEDYLEKYPRASMASELAMADLEGIEATLYGLYNRMQGWHLATHYLAGGLLTDELKVAAANSGRMITYPTNQENTSSFVSWSGRYNDINRLNMMLYYVDELEGDFDETRLNRLKGEAHAMRGYIYFNLLKVYARPYMYQTPLVQGEPLGVTIKLDPFMGIDEDSFEPRATIDEGYQVVLDELEMAISLLPETNDDFPYRFTNISAKALLAKIHLYMGNWTEAASYAEDVIADGNVNLTGTDNYIDAFAETPGSESILEMGYTSDDRPGMNESIQGLAWYDPPTGYGDLILRRDLINLLEEYRTKGDVRPEMTYEYTKVGEDVVFQDKFAGYAGPHAYWDDYPVIRTAEMYLIAAEAYAELDQLTDARNILTDFREHRMDQENAEVTVDTKEELIDLILTERRVEFFCEMSHRWFDLRRRGMGIPKGCPDEDPGIPLEFDDYRIVGRIPNAEMEANENAIQNPGY